MRFREVDCISQHVCDAHQLFVVRMHVPADSADLARADDVRLAGGALHAPPERDEPEQLDVFLEPDAFVEEVERELVLREGHLEDVGKVGVREPERVEAGPEFLERDASRVATLARCSRRLERGEVLRLVAVADPMAPPLARLDSRVDPRDIVELRDEPFCQDPDGREGTPQDGADVLSGRHARPLVGPAALGLVRFEQFDRFDRAPCQEDLQHGNDMQKDLRLEVVLCGRCRSVLYTRRAGLRRHGRTVFAATERRARHARVPECREGGRDHLDHGVRDEQALGNDGAEEVLQSQRERRQLGESAGDLGVSFCRFKQTRNNFVWKTHCCFVKKMP